MSDTVEQLADDYQEHRLRAMPTWAHMIGEYAHADRFEEIGREAEDRLVEEVLEFARRAEALSEDGLDEQQRITRAMVAWDATQPGGDPVLADGRVRRRPGLRGAGQPGCPDPEAGPSRRRRRRGDGRQAARHRVLLLRPRRPARRRGGGRAYARCVRRRRDGRAARRLARQPGRRRPAAPHGRDPGRGRCGRVAGPARRRSSRARSGRRWRRTATCCATRSPRWPGPTTRSGSPGCRTATTSTRGWSATTRRPT